MRYFFLLFLIVTLSACGTAQIGQQSWYVPPPAYTDGKEVDPPEKVVWITIDGTGNSLISRTNAGKLFGMVDSYAPKQREREVLTYYADGVGSDGNPLGGGVGVGMQTDIRNAYAYLTRTWNPGDQIYLSGFSRGAYAARALTGFIYAAGIPNLQHMPMKQRNRIVKDLFRAYKTGKRSDNPNALAEKRRQRVEQIYAKHGLTQMSVARKYGYQNPSSRAIITAFYGWDSVQAMGLPDGIESPVEGPAHYLMTNCNIGSVFHALSLDDNRVYSFTPVLARGPKMSQLCNDGQSLNAQRTMPEEVWFSGAHADVGGTYNIDNVLDGRMPSVSFKWMVNKVKNASAALIDPKAYIREDRYALIHDPETDGIMKALYRQSRKPLPYAQMAYRTDQQSGTIPIKIHASVFDRLEYLFALDKKWASCARGAKKRDGVRLLCAKEIASYSLVPELSKLGILEPSVWGYRLIDKPEKVALYVAIDGTRATTIPPQATPCVKNSSPGKLTAHVFRGKLTDYRNGNVKREEIEIDYPFCADPD